MTAWTINRTDTGEHLAAGEAPDARLAWARLIPILLNHLTEDGSTRGYTITIDQGIPATVFPGREEDGAINIPETRDSLERLAIDSMGPAVFSDPH